MENYAVTILIKSIHLLATVAWIGGMLTNFFIYMPVIGKVLDPPTTGKLMGAVMKRFKVMVYISMGLFLITGMISGYIHGGLDPSEVESNWNIIFSIKVGIFAFMVVLAVYAFEFMAPKVAKIAANGPSPELAKIQKSQISLAMIGFVLGIIILVMSAAL